MHVQLCSYSCYPEELLNLSMCSILEYIEELNCMQCQDKKNHYLVHNLPLYPFADSLMNLQMQDWRSILIEGSIAGEHLLELGFRGLF